MITSLIATLAIGAMAPADLSCPVMGSAVPANAKGVDYGGVRYLMCCAGCDGTFAKNPTKYTKAAEGKTIGYSLFDPVSGIRVDSKKAKGTMDFGGVRYYFASEDDLAAFKADSKKYTKAPEKEVLYCAVMGHAIEDYATAGAYVDIKGIRYYTCCGDCQAEMKKAPDGFTSKVKDKVAAPKVRTYKQEG